MLFRQKRRNIRLDKTEQQIQSVNQSTIKKIKAMGRNADRLNKLLEANGITLEIKKATGGKHV